MNPTVPLILFIWPPLTLFLFRWLPSHRAVLISFIAAFLFLPQHGYPLPVLPDYDRLSAALYSIGLGVILFDLDRLKGLRLTWFDLPLIVWCVCPFFTSIDNDLGAYDGVLAMLRQFFLWGAPYLIGRMYFGTLEGLRRLAVGVFIAGLVYIPFCLYEIRMSPQIHRMVYGFYGGSFAQSIRYGGYRPMVFLRHGLMVGSLMMSSSLVGLWLWRSKTIDSILGIPMKWLVAAQLVVFVMVKSTGAILLMLLGSVVMFVSRWLKLSILVWFLVLSVPSYVYLAASGNVNTSGVVTVAAEVINPDRAQSLEFRFEQEEPLAEKARERWLLGWGGWDRFSLYGGWSGEKISTTDSLWIIAFGSLGAVGLASLIATLLLPLISFLVAYPARLWSDKRLAPAFALAMVLLLYTIDNLLNDMKIPLYLVGAGGLMGVLTQVEFKNGMNITASHSYLPPALSGNGHKSPSLPSSLLSAERNSETFTE